MSLEQSWFDENPFNYLSHHKIKCDIEHAVNKAYQHGFNKNNFIVFSINNSCDRLLSDIGKNLKYDNRVIYHISEVGFEFKTFFPERYPISQTIRHSITHRITYYFNLEILNQIWIFFSCKHNICFELLKIVKSYIKNKKLLQITQSEMSDKFISIHPDNNFYNIFPRKSGKNTWRCVISKMNSEKRFMMNYFYKHKEALFHFEKRQNKVNLIHKPSFDYLRKTSLVKQKERSIVILLAKFKNDLYKKSLDLSIKTIKRKDLQRLESSLLWYYRRDDKNEVRFQTSEIANFYKYIKFLEENKKRENKFADELWGTTISQLHKKRMLISLKHLTCLWKKNPRGQFPGMQRSDILKYIEFEKKDWKKHDKKVWKEQKKFQKSKKSKKPQGKIDLNKW